MKSLTFSIDRGGTFTDIYCEIHDSESGLITYDVHKLLSVDPQHYKDASREGIRRLLEKHLGKTFDASQPINTAHIKSIRIGTTVATNALLEHQGEPTCLAITKGFKDLLEIGNQSRPSIFDLEIKKPENLYSHVIEVEERIILSHSLNARKDVDLYPENRRVKLETGEIIILKELDQEKVQKDLQAAYDSGLRALAIVLMHSYLYSKHEEIIRDLAAKIGFTQISISSDVFQRIKIVSRGQTTTIDAYLNPKIRKYIDSFTEGFDSGIHDKVNLFFMQSDGGLSSAKSFSGVKAILSGPAGGIIGYSKSTFNHKLNTSKKPTIGFDMGGTSTDVSKYDGHYDHIFETNIAGFSITAPQLDINTVAAGGGSRLFFKNGLFKVGPESAGADPGPVCYRKNGHLAITDANLLLGRLIPRYFPKIFGEKHDQPLDVESTEKAFTAIAEEINSFYSEKQEKSKDIYEIAYGFIKVANETMCRAIRTLTQARGLDPKNYVLSVFGGAGAQHACSMARTLGIKSIFIHKLCGVLSAYGINIADVTVESEHPLSLPLSPESLKQAEKIFEDNRTVNLEKLRLQGFDKQHVRHEKYLNLKYEGSDTTIMVLAPEDEDYEKAFHLAHSREYGFNFQDRRKVIVENVRVRSAGTFSDDQSSYKILAYNEKLTSSDSKLEPDDYHETYFEIEGTLKKVKVPVFDLVNLPPNKKIEGPCIILNNTSTILVEHGWEALTDESKSIWLEYSISDKILDENVRISEIKVDPIELSIFGHRFMSIAEQMGRVLQRTAISTNIKERLDFSCAIFSPDGSLVANAPHIPVHLGSMGECVRFQTKLLGENWKDGEVVLTNHPLAGGTHLPDITLITPVFKDGKPVFYLASRGHHADIGGLTPGSMPPFSKKLEDEGVNCISLKVVKDGVFQEEDVIKLMTNQDKPHLQGTRNLRDNLSDFKAQIAANNKGRELLHGLIHEYGLGYVQAYMKFIQDAAEESVRDMLCQISKELGLKEIDSVYSEDYMDDGTPIALTLKIDRKTRSAVFDFTNSGLQIIGNCNAPKAVTNSAIIYCLRCLVRSDIPLNQGCMAPIKIIFPEGSSILNPSADAAVVGGNVLTSQRLTDVILKAFQAAADSYGDMNNLTFGTDKWGYYETIAGGSGAGPYWHGKNGVQCHMTNTRITDPEVMEWRYPLILRQYSIREKSGGKGKFNGGNGLLREIEFLEGIQVSILSERRAFAPNGIRGGENGKRAVTVYRRKDGLEINFGGKNTEFFEPGSAIKIMSSGGGGYGKKEEALNEKQKNVISPEMNFASGSLGNEKMLQETN